MIERGQDFRVIVDYAHTDDALTNLLATVALSPLKITTVFGCGGDRDRQRARWGAGRGSGSDLVRRRGTDPERILDDAEKGVLSVPGARDHYRRIVDRREAIAATVALASRRSRGDQQRAETIQILRDRTVSFDDRLVAIRCPRSEAGASADPQRQNEDEAPGRSRGTRRVRLTAEGSRRDGRADRAPGTAHERPRRADHGRAADAAAPKGAKRRPTRPAAQPAEADTAPEFTSFAIDSRRVLPGSLFFALRGPRLDGHDFLEEAAAAGAAGFVVSREDALERWGQGRTDRIARSTNAAGKRARTADRREEAARGHGEPLFFLVPDTTRALQDLAANARGRLSLVVGITGSAGKTTTKEMTAAVLERRRPTGRTAGNLNNLYGLPLTLLNLPAEATAAVLEMGMSTPGEIARLAEIADPDVGVILNVGSPSRKLQLARGDRRGEGRAVPRHAPGRHRSLERPIRSCAGWPRRSPGRSSPSPSTAPPI
jgi:hypothetical protein